MRLLALHIQLYESCLIGAFPLDYSVDIVAYIRALLFFFIYVGYMHVRSNYDLSGSVLFVYVGQYNVVGASPSNHA